jgi:F-box interacting protein
METGEFPLDTLCWIAPLYMFDNDNDGHQKIMFGTGNRIAFSVDANGGTMETLFKADDDTITDSFADCDHPSLGLFEESLVPVGRTIEEIAFSSPGKQAWFDILKWMPARSVANLSLVCGEWRAMIMTDRFIRSHILHANLNKSPRIRMIINPPVVGYIDLQFFSDLGAPACGLSLPCSQPCHGLNVGGSRIGSFVCNPIMGYSEDIWFEEDEDMTFSGRIGLGYNSKTSKHVLVLAQYKSYLSTLEYHLECKLRYVEEDEWRSIDPPPRPILASTAPTFANGKICWLVEPNLEQASPTCEVVAFNVQSEEFEVLQGPQCNHPVGRMSIICLKDALCVACSNKSINVIDIWMRKEDNGTWLREYRIDLTKFYPEYSSEETTPLAIDPKDGRILLSTGWSLGYYDPKTAALETIYNMGMQDDHWKFSPIICDESLIFTLGLA